MAVIIIAMCYDVRCDFIHKTIGGRCRSFNYYSVFQTNELRTRFFSYYFISDFLSYMFHIINYIYLSFEISSAGLRYSFGERHRRRHCVYILYIVGRDRMSNHTNQSSVLANCSLTFKNYLGHRVPFYGKWADCYTRKFGTFFLQDTYFARRS